MRLDQVDIRYRNLFYLILKHYTKIRYRLNYTMILSTNRKQIEQIEIHEQNQSQKHEQYRQNRQYVLIL